MQRIIISLNKKIRVIRMSWREDAWFRTPNKYGYSTINFTPLDRFNFAANTSTYR